MAYRTPSSRRNKKEVKSPNLIPILDAVFIFIFFLLMSASFIKIYEIPSDVPIISDKPSKEKDPFFLTLKINEDKLILTKGINDEEIESFPKESGKYNLEKLHNTLISIKREKPKENTIIFEPISNPTYEEIVNIMDAVRTLRNTDPAFYIKDSKTKLDTKVQGLFDNIIFGNIQS